MASEMPANGWQVRDRGPIVIDRPSVVIRAQTITTALRTKGVRNLRVL
jgi:hypothetical protein